MTRNIVAILAILVCTTAAWTILGTTIFARTYNAGSGLSTSVQSSWGKPQQQAPPIASTAETTTKEIETLVDGRVARKVVDETVWSDLPIEQSRINVAFALDQRQKGLLWFATYRVSFRGAYVFRNTTASNDVRLKLMLPVPEAVYDDLVFRIDGDTVATTIANGTVSANVKRPPGSLIRFDVGYTSQGLDTWQYSFGENAVQVRNFVLEMTTDFAAIDFPTGALSPSERQRTADGWLLRWKYSNVVTGYRIGMVMPQKLQPGPLAGRISYFAPVSLLFFFFLMFVITTLKRIPLHPMHYFFLATSFFAFHLLLAYLVDHVSIHVAFVICSAVSIFLVVSYLRVVIGPRFAYVEAAIAQLVYLVGFSYAFFFKGFTGLVVTIGAIASLFLVMQMTARLEWGSVEQPA